MEVQNLEKSNKGIRYLLNVIDIYTRFLWVVPLADKEEQTVLDGFNDIIMSLDQKPLYLLHRLRYVSLSREYFYVIRVLFSKNFF